MPVEGLEDLARLIKNLKSLQGETQKAMVREVTRDSEQIAEINRDYMAVEGELPSGKQIQPQGYSRSYARFKKAYGRYKNTAFVDFKISGRLHESIRFEHIASEVWQLKSSGVPYARDLLSRYGQFIGLRTKDLLNYVSVILKPKLVDDIKRQLKR